MPHYTTWGGTYVTRPVVIEDRDYSDNDYDINDIAIQSKQVDGITGIKSAAQGIKAEAAGATYRTDNIGTNSGPGGSTFRTDSYQEKAQLMQHAPKESEYRPEAQVNPVGVGYTEVEWTYFADNLAGTAGPGGSTFRTENVSAGFPYDTQGLYLSAFDVMNNVGGSAGPGGDDV